MGNWMETIVTVEETPIYLRSSHADHRLRPSRDESSVKPTAPKEGTGWLWIGSWKGFSGQWRAVGTGPQGNGRNLLWQWINDVIFTRRLCQAYSLLLLHISRCLVSSIAGIRAMAFDAMLECLQLNLMGFGELFTTSDRWRDGHAGQFTKWP